MRDHDHRRAGRSDADEHVEHHGAGFLIEAAGRFVGNDESRPGDEGASNSDALLLATAELGWKAFGLPTEPHGTKGVEALLTATATRGRSIAELQGQLDILAGVQCRQEMEVLEDDADVAAPPTGEPIVRQLIDPHPVDDERARRRPIDAGDQGTERRLAGSRGPDDGDELAAVDLEVDAVDAELGGGTLAPPACEIDRVNQRGRGWGPRRRPQSGW